MTEHFDEKIFSNLFADMVKNDSMISMPDYYVNIKSNIPGVLLINKRTKLPLFYFGVSGSSLVNGGFFKDFSKNQTPGESIISILCSVVNQKLNS